MFVKPANLGSSVGISKVKAASELAAAMRLALEFDRKIVIEAGVPAAREIECAVLGNDRPEASVPGEIVPSREFYDYEAKYVEESKSIMPAPLDAATTADVRRLAVEAFLAVEASGFARVDFLLSRETGRLYVNEINTIPGFTTISMFPKLWEATGLGYRALLDRLVALAFERHAARQTLPHEPSVDRRSPPSPVARRAMDGARLSRPRRRRAARAGGLDPVRAGARPMLRRDPRRAVRRRGRGDREGVRPRAAGDVRAHARQRALVADPVEPQRPVDATGRSSRRSTA